MSSDVTGLVSSVYETAIGRDGVSAIASAVNWTLSAFPNLQPHQKDFVNNDGSYQRLLCLAGTIPAVVHGATYHIPIDVWIPHKFPESPPIVYVVPTNAMAIRPSEFVDVSGFVNFCNHPAFFSWSSKSNGDYRGVDSACLMTLMESLSAAFGKKCPVVAKTADQTLRQQQTDAQTATRIGTHHHGAASHVNANHLTHITDHSRYPDIEGTERFTFNAAGSTRSDLMDSLTQKIKQYMLQSTASGSDIAVLRKKIGILEGGARRLETLKQNAQSEISALDASTDSLAKANDTLQSELSTMQACLQHDNGDAVDPVDFVVTSNELHAQMLELIVEDSAIEDTIYVLSTGLTECVVDLSTSLKILRGLLRRQFHVRTKLNKAKKVVLLAYQQ